MKEKNSMKNPAFKKYIGKSVKFCLHRNKDFLRKNAVNTPFITYTRNIKTKSLSSGKALRSRTPQQFIEVDPFKIAPKN